MPKVQMNKPILIPPIRMHNRLKEFEELLVGQHFAQSAKLGFGGQKSQVEIVVVNSPGVHKRQNP